MNRSKSTRLKCFVPTCKNTTCNSRNKLFVRVKETLKRRWCEEVNVEYKPARSLLCCEDHLNLEEDLENYQYYKFMKGKPILKSSAKLRGIQTLPSCRQIETTVAETAPTLKSLLLQPIEVFPLLTQRNKAEPLIEKNTPTIISASTHVIKVGATPKPKSQKKNEEKKQHNDPIQENANISTDEELPANNEESADEAETSEDESEKGSPVIEKVFVKSVPYKEGQSEDGQIPPKRTRLETSELPLEYTEELYEFGKYVAEQLLCLDVEDARVAQKEITEVLWKFNANNVMRCTTKQSTLNEAPATNENCASIVTRKVPQVNPVVSPAVQSGSKAITARPLVSLPVFCVTAGPSVTQTSSQVKLKTPSKLVHGPSLSKFPVLSVNPGASSKAPFGYIVVQKSTDPRITFRTLLGNREGKLVTQPGSGTAVGSIVTKSVICAGTPITQLGSSSRTLPEISMKTEPDATQPESSSRLFSETLIKTEPHETQPESSSIEFSETSVKIEPDESEVSHTHTSETDTESVKFELDIEEEM